LKVVCRGGRLVNDYILRYQRSHSRQQFQFHEIRPSTFSGVADGKRQIDG